MVISLNRLTIHFMIFLALFFLILIELNGEELNLNLSQFSISNNSSDEAALKRLFKSSITSSGTTLQRRICYFANWGPYRKIKPPLYPNNIDPSLCTHIHYAFAKIDPATLTLQGTEEYDMNWTEKSNMPLYIRLYSLKRKNPALKILLAVGGWSVKSSGFNAATRTIQNRSKFINQTISFLREWNFDGIDLDWEFPGDPERGADLDSKQNFDALISELRNAINAEAKLNGKKRLLISSAVTPDPKKIDQGYVVKNLCQQLDYISVMTYDYSGYWEMETGLNSPLYSRDDEKTTVDGKSAEKWKNVNYSINYWISSGCPPEKINLGLAAYGRSFTLKNISENKVGSPAIKGGEAGAYTREEGIYAYFEICEKINVDNWQKKWDNVQQSVYATLEDQWVGYDNERSISLKVKWAASMLLGGTMLWTLDFDDYSGKFCNDGPFPLASAIKSVFDEFTLNDNINTTSSQNQSLMIEFDKQFTGTLEISTSTQITKKEVETSTTSPQAKLVPKENQSNLTNLAIKSIDLVISLVNITDTILYDTKGNYANLSLSQISKDKNINSLKNSAQNALENFNLFSLVLIVLIYFN